MQKLSQINHFAHSNATNLQVLTNKTLKELKSTVKQTQKSIIDLSTEELGFFTIDGKRVKTIFPR